MDLLPTPGFHFDRPLVLFQSDDWGRVGLRDREGLQQLRAGGLALGERPYDLYTLESAEDLAEMRALLKSHRDSAGRHPCLEMNFIVANLDFSQMSVNGWKQVRLLPLAEGLPAGWIRPGLLEAYREGIDDRVFQPALHGTTHFCRQTVERNLEGGGERANLLRTLWQAGTPYIYWRMPWIGYEYWDPEKPEEERFLSAGSQRELIGQTLGAFARLFSLLPRSACAPGYRANRDTHRGWAQHGIQVVQNGPGRLLPPYFDREEILQLSRTVEFEPGTDQNFSLASCLERAERCFAHGIPAVVSIHSINFHSSVRDFRRPTLKLLNDFLAALESKYPRLLYLHSQELSEIVQTGSRKAEQGTTRIGVTKKKFRKGQAERVE
jgi:hypothetical protein